MTIPAIRLIQWRKWGDDDDTVTLCEPSKQAVADALREEGFEFHEPVRYSDEPGSLIVVADRVVTEVPESA